MSPLDETRRRPSGEKAHEVTPSCASTVLRHAPFFTSQSLRVLSSLPPETMRRPSGENAHEVTPLVCPSRVAWQAPVSASHSLRVESLPTWPAPETMRRPSGEKAQAVTQPEVESHRGAGPSPSRVASQAPVSASQSLRVLSLPPE